MREWKDFVRERLQLSELDEQRQEHIVEELAQQLEAKAREAFAKTEAAARRSQAELEKGNELVGLTVAEAERTQALAEEADGKADEARDEAARRSDETADRQADGQQQRS